MGGGGRGAAAADHHSCALMTASESGFTRQQHGYVWSPAGDLESRQDYLNDQHETFSYDALHRFDTASLDGVEHMDVDYDALGNIVSKTGVGTYAYDADGRLQSTDNGAETVDYKYDDNGAVTQRGAVALTWTAFRKVASIDDGIPITFRYDADGTRRVRRRNVTSTKSVTSDIDVDISPDKIVGHIRVHGGGRPVAELELSRVGGVWTKQVTYLHDDHLGSGTLVTGPGTDAPVDRDAAYDPWGQPRDSSDWTTALASSSLDDHPVGFTGQPRPPRRWPDGHARPHVRPCCGALLERRPGRRERPRRPNLECLQLRQQPAALSRRPDRARRPRRRPGLGRR
jgi:YD repeat-containing protein